MNCLPTRLYPAVLLAALLPGHAQPQAEPVYSLGVVPQFDSRKIARIWQPVIHAIEQQSGLKIRLAGAPSIPAFENAFSKGEYDFAYMNPYHALVANRIQDYQPIVRDVGRHLFGIIVVHKDSAIHRIEQLDNKTVAFPAPNALGAALIPRAVFATRYHINIKPKYVNSHGSVYLNVFLGQSEAGGGVQKTFDQQPQKIKKQLRILYKTPKVAPHPIVVHPRVKREDVEKFVQAILKMGNSKKGRVLLGKVPIRQAGKASLEDYLPLQTMGLDKFYVK